MSHVIIRHVRSGNFYRFVGLARGAGNLEGRDVAFYQQLDTTIDRDTGKVINKGMYWARDAEEFYKKFQFPSSYCIPRSTST